MSARKDSSTVEPRSHEPLYNEGTGTDNERCSSAQ